MTEEYITVTQYSAETGAFEGIRTGQKKSIDQEGRPYIEGRYDPDEYYVDLSSVPSRVEKRPEMPVSQNLDTIRADGNETLILSSLPEPCRTMIGAHKYDVEDGVLEWSTLMPGAYSVRIQAWPYLDWKGEVTAVAGDS